jgi:hypothetical protein
MMLACVVVGGNSSGVVVEGEPAEFGWLRDSGESPIAEDAAKVLSSRFEEYGINQLTH